MALFLCSLHSLHVQASPGIAYLGTARATDTASPPAIFVAGAIYVCIRLQSTTCVGPGDGSQRAHLFTRSAAWSYSESLIINTKGSSALFALR